MAWMNGRRTVRCYNCYGVGHNKRNCPDLSPEKKEYYAKGAGARKCSYCGESKHNKKTCATRKADIAKYIKDNAVYRAEMLELIKKEGIGVGALITFQNGNNDVMYMVTEIDWPDIQLKHPSRRSVKGICMSDKYGADNFPFSFPENRHNLYAGYSALKVISPAKNVVDGVPEGWLNGESGATDLSAWK